MALIPAFLLAANLAYFLTVHTTPGRAVSAIGALVALVLLVAARVPTVAWRLERELPPPRSAAFLGSIVAFALPVLGMTRALRVEFLSVDLRLLLVLAWLGTLSLFLAAAHDRASTSHPRGPLVRRLPVLTALFVFWTALFWLTLVWDVGVGTTALSQLKEDRLSTTFKTWETHQASEHLFLVWLSPEAFARREAYSNHVHPYLFLMYGGAKFVQLATGLPLTVGRNLMLFVWPLLGAGVFSVWLLRSGRSSRIAPLKLYATSFVMVGFLMTEGHYWRYVYVTNQDTVFPLLVYLAALVWAVTLPRASGRNRASVMTASVVFALFGPSYVPILMVALWCCHGRVQPTLAATLARNRGLVRASLVSVAIGAIAYCLPVGLVMAKGYSNVASTLAFRSGLDGDTTYFHDAVQAVLRPYWGDARTPLTLLVPAYLPLLTCLVLTLGDRRIVWYGWLSSFAFLITPYLFSLVMFPQAVAIHPYLYDQLLFLPAALVAGIWATSAPVQRRLRGPVLLLVGLLMAGLLMSNLITVAQTMRGLSLARAAEQRTSGQ